MTWWLLPRVRQRAWKKLLKVRLKIIPRERMPWLTLMLTEMRFDGAKFIAL
jgi:hypothetical protein